MEVSISKNPMMQNQEVMKKKAVEEEQNHVNSFIIEFKQFDIVTSDKFSDVFDHHYGISSTSNNNSCILPTKQIMKEWKILQDNLPDSIFVRAYEGRIDLLRAVIIGAQGTPYHDGLFFFDIQFPSNYPNQPPQVHYHSFGFRLNPNLYSCGKVCLSLLNTWNGLNNEKWNPSKSTILQVLVSIQGLVLNDNPYFNEPRDYSLNLKQHESKSMSYNEEAFLLSCKTMLAVLNKPPNHFEEFVARHFRDRAENILIACKAYKQAGGFNINSRPTGNGLYSFFSHYLYLDFMSSLERIIIKLVTAFARNGSSLESLLAEPEKGDVQDCENKYFNKTNTTTDQTVNRGGDWFVKRAFSKLIQIILGLFKMGNSTTTTATTTTTTAAEKERFEQMKWERRK